MSHERLKISVLVSPDSFGSNLRAVYDAGFNVGLVVADRKSAPAFGLAQEHNTLIHVARYKLPEGMDKEEYRDQYSENLAGVLNKEKTDIALMAGFNRILNKPFFETFRKPILNIHPGAVPDKKDEPFIYEGIEIPWNQGMQQEAAIENFLSLPFAFSTIHMATEETDFGPVLKRVHTKVLPGDTVETLYARLKIEEHKGLIDVLTNQF